jgi:hypothetical protein
LKAGCTWISLKRGEAGLVFTVTGSPAPIGECDWKGLDRRSASGGIKKGVRWIHQIGCNNADQSLRFLTCNVKNPYPMENLSCRLSVWTS